MLIDYYCENPRCENYLSLTAFEDDLTDWPLCPQCGQRLKGRAPGVRLFREHYVWRRRDDGSVERIKLTSYRHQAWFCRDQGLVNPLDLPEHGLISADGTKIEKISAKEDRQIVEAIKRGEKLERQPLSSKLDMRGIEVNVQAVDKSEIDSA